jgi:hypothetical protein
MQILASVRASDADRDRAAERLRQATAEGRLGGEELEARLEALYASRTYGELEAVVADLPVARPLTGPSLRVGLWVGVAMAGTLLLGVLGTLVLTRGRLAAAIVASHLRPLNPPGPIDPHDVPVVAGATVVVFVASLVCAAALWAVIRTRSSRNL